MQPTHLHRYIELLAEANRRTVTEQAVSRRNYYYYCMAVVLLHTLTHSLTHSIDHYSAHG